MLRDIHSSVWKIFKQSFAAITKNYWSSLVYKWIATLKYASKKYLWWRMQAIIFKSHSPTFNFNESFTMYAWIHICKNQSCNVNPLRANPTKWPNTLKKFVGKLPTNCLSVFDHFEKLALKGFKMYNSIPGCWESKLPPPIIESSFSVNRRIPPHFV